MAPSPSAARSAKGLTPSGAPAVTRSRPGLSVKGAHPRSALELGVDRDEPVTALNVLWPA